MKGISTVIATLLMLVITLGLIGLAYSYITGVFTARTAVVLTAQPECSGTNIKVTVKNDGTAPIPWNSITVSGTKPDGTPITGGTCTASGNLPAGTSGDCGLTLTGGVGTNTIRVTGGGSTSTSTVYCPG